MHISIKQLRLFSLRRKLDIKKYDDLSFILNQVIAFVPVKNQKNYLQWDSPKIHSSDLHQPGVHWRGTLEMRLEAIVMAT